MKNCLLLSIVLLVVLPLRIYAQIPCDSDTCGYEVISCKPENEIIANGKIVAPQQKLYRCDEIEWPGKGRGQWIKVKSCLFNKRGKNKIFTFTPNGLKEENVPVLTLFGGFLSSKPMITLSVNDEIFIDTVYYLVDSLELDAGKKYGNDVRDIVEIIINDSIVKKEIHRSYDGLYFVIERSLFDKIEPQTVYINIIEEDKNLNWSYYIYRKLKVELLEE